MSSPDAAVSVAAVDAAAAVVSADAVSDAAGAALDPAVVADVDPQPASKAAAIDTDNKILTIFFFIFSPSVYLCFVNNSG